MNVALRALAPVPRPHVVQQHQQAGSTSRKSDDLNTTVFRALIPTADEATRGAIARTLRRFDASLLRRAVNFGIRIHPLAEHETYEQASPTIAEAKLNFNKMRTSPAGLFVVRERNIYLRLVSRMTVAHEFAHAIDCMHGGGTYLSDQSVAIRQAFASARSFVTPYAAVGVDEYFAECVRAYVQANDPGSPWPQVSKKTLHAHDPAMFAIIDMMLQPTNT